MQDDDRFDERFERLWEAAIDAGAEDFVKLDPADKLVEIRVRGYWN